MQRFALLLTLPICMVLAADKYDGPRPPKPDLVYLVHADNLVPTEAAEAKEESGVYTMPGATSPARSRSGRSSPSSFPADRACR